MVRFVRVTYVRRALDPDSGDTPSTTAAVTTAQGDYLDTPSTTAAATTAPGDHLDTLSTRAATTTTAQGDYLDIPSTTVAATTAPGDYLPPKGFSYKTFVPSPVKVAMCSGAPVYESFASTWERARVWLRLVGQNQSERKCADTIGTLLVPRAGRFQ